MLVFKKHDVAPSDNFMDYCYLDTQGRHEQDTQFNDVFAFEAFLKVHQIDYIQFRNMCKDILLPDWNNLSEDNKRVLVSHNIAPTEEDKLFYYSLDDQLDNFHAIVTAEIDARQQRWNDAMITAAFMLKDTQVRLDMYNSVYEFKDKYIDADLPHIIFWLQNAIYPVLDINFSLTGFRSKLYYREEIEIECLKILTK